LNVEEVRGKWFEKSGARVLVTYHPAAGMRFPEVGREMARDEPSREFGKAAPKIFGLA